jgi:glycosidase
MLWDETRQDQDQLHYYKRLIDIRKENSCLTMGDPDEISADDEAGLVVIRRGNLVILFHGKDGIVSLPEYQGKNELISGVDFNGQLDAYQAAVIEL